ncbi:MAG: HlyC/CorC family transporter [Chromatiales bacterium]
MPDVPIGALFAGLIVLILLSAFFSGSETALMTVNRYRLRHLADQHHRGAVRVSGLLERPDRLIGLILLGNNFVNNLASSLATVIALSLMGRAGIALAAALLTLVMLIFSEVAPKTLAVLYPEKVAFPASTILAPLLRLFYPVVWIVNLFANGLLRLIGVRLDEGTAMPLSREELRTVVKEAGALIPKRHQQMLVGILDLEKISVQDVMVPRNEIVAIDLEEDAAIVTEHLRNCRHTRTPIYRGTIDNVLGLVHARQIPRIIGPDQSADKEVLEKLLLPAYYVPFGTPLHTQLANFQRQRQRLGIIVDEYGDVQGLLTLEDILEEIVGKFTTDPQRLGRGVLTDVAGGYLVEGGANVRELNRKLRWRLPTTGPKTLNGLILEALESIPEAGTALRIGGYTIEIMQTTDHAVKTARVTPPAESRLADGK